MDRSLFSPPIVPKRSSRPDDRRLGELLSQSYETADVVVLGFPSDEGVKRNGGRSGASQAPDRIRQFLFGLCPDSRHFERHSQLISKTVDFGNLILSNNLEENQVQLGYVVAQVLADGKIPIVLGGGHETTFGHFLGYEHAERDVFAVNLDAHPDVREKIDQLGHSGSPFRQILESSRVKTGYAVLGLQPSAVSAQHIDYLRREGINFGFRDTFDISEYKTVLQSVEIPILASFDIDVCDVSIAPGVSAPAVDGLRAIDLLETMFEAGRSPNVHSMDVVEVNPEFDIDNRTSRLAARGIWIYLLGLSSREVEI